MIGPNILHPFFFITNKKNWDVRDELSTYNGIVFKGERVVIPHSLRPDMLRTLHRSHSGIVKTKQKARDRIYWPGMNRQIEEVTEKCDVCLKNRPKQQKEPLTIHPLPALPWNKVGTDLFEYEGDHYLILVDYFSNYIEVCPLKQDTKSTAVIKNIKLNIARYGIMETLISDNGPQFTSTEFHNFTQEYGINHITSSPTHPQSNGLAEKAVQTVKSMIKKCKEGGEDIYLALLDLRNTPRDDTTGSPMQRLHGRRAVTSLPTAESLLKPGTKEPSAVHEKMLEYRRRQKLYHDRGAKRLPSLKPSDAVRVWSPEGWKPAELLKPHQQPNSYLIKAGQQGRTYRRNRRDLMTTKEQPHTITTPEVIHVEPPSPPPPQLQNKAREQQNQTTPLQNVVPPSPTRMPHTPSVKPKDTAHFQNRPQSPTNQAPSPSIDTAQLNNENIARMPAVNRTASKRQRKQPAWTKDYVMGNQS